ncbi:hypothetical protein Patl1_12393 [Pistacia atlantica]|uniref:Uncharacterized protein n=1 Tax=Pistacia atlantica TaxID=434234 RepID=A0ACC1A6V6_9ROSI|nr:hypothetical protein Patl1_12393 [Pistacia atlantica]
MTDEDLRYGLSMKDSLAAVCKATQAAARIHQVFRVQSFQKKKLKEYGEDAFGISDEHALSLVAVKSHKAGHHDEPVHAAAAHVRGHQGSGLHGFKSEALTESSSMIDSSTKEDDYDFLKEGRKQKKERLQKALARVKSMVQYPEARDKYSRLLNVVNEIQETKAMTLKNSEVSAEFDDNLTDIEALLDDDTFMPAA